MRLDDPYLRVVQMFGKPLRVNQHLGMCIVFHWFYLLLLITKF